MKNINRVLCVVLISIGLLTTVSEVFAQPASCPTGVSLAPGSYTTMIPGVNCGVPNDPDPCMRRCCVEAVIQKPGVDLPGVLDLVPGLEGMLNKQLENQLNPIIEEKRNNEIVPCQVGSPSVPGDLSNPACECIHPTPGALNAIMELCGRIQNPAERTNCENCLQGKNADQKAGVWTGMGCIYANIGDFIQNTLLRWGVGIAGGISLLCIIYAAFMMQTSGGNPEKVKKAQQLMTSCITGLILVIFSVFILRLIGVTILRIPGFI